MFDVNKIGVSNKNLSKSTNSLNIFYHQKGFLHIFEIEAFNMHTINWIIIMSTITKIQNLDQAHLRIHENNS